MPDREKVIRKLKEALENAENEGEIFAEVRRPVLFDALALLQEQEKQKFFVDESGKITPLPIVVQCKDCKHFDGLNCKVNDITNIMDTNWFCADGEKAVSE